jgi:hypothetical protein
LKELNKLEKIVADKDRELELKNQELEHGKLELELKNQEIEQLRSFLTVSTPQ